MILEVVFKGAGEDGVEGVTVEPGVALGIEEVFFWNGFGQLQEAEVAFLPLAIYLGPGPVAIGLVDPGIYLFEMFL